MATKGKLFGFQIYSNFIVDFTISKKVVNLGFFSCHMLFGKLEGYCRFRDIAS